MRRESGPGPAPGTDLLDRLSHAFLTRTAPGQALAGLVDQMRRRRVPRGWTGLLGAAAVACVVVLVVTGVALTFFYTPSRELVTYDGAHGPLRGAEVSLAFDSTMAISTQVRGGLLLRQAHHWAALLLPAILLLQLLVMFFTGGFRRPRQGSWVLLFLLLVVVLLGGWTGYALPDDLLSGTGLRVVHGILLGIPVVGSWLSMVVFGGEFPGTVIEHFYPVHVLVVPVLVALLMVARLRSSWVHGPPQPARPGADERHVVGMPMIPEAAGRATGMFAVVTGMLLLFGSSVTISPVWAYGPSSPGEVSAGSQPDWYTGFLDGALRLVPRGWEVEWLDRTWTLAVVVPLAAVGLFLGLVMLYPYLEAALTGDRREHHVLERPRHAPVRTGLGVAGMTFYGVLWAAASSDILATHFHLGVEGVVTTLQIALVLGPVTAFALTRLICHGLQRRDREVARHGHETGRIVQLPEGRFVEVRTPVAAGERWRLLPPGRAEPDGPPEDEDPRGEDSRSVATLAR
ncbi:cytochrome b [Georgenia alba]|uniref:Cytochrome bc1 complex cytochrome b subunit n=1 Tax=Georgenia alba TaxID=2233858 RepID=A0ABW2Q9W0_9MICO